MNTLDRAIAWLETHRRVTWCLLGACIAASLLIPEVTT